MSSISSYSPAGNALSLLILEVFRLNGRLLSAGDQLVGEIGLTSARWQVLGAIHLAGRPASVAQLARSMGLARQGVQRIINELAGEGLISFGPNPNHRRSKLVAMTSVGHQIYQAALKLQTPWVSFMSDGLDPRLVREATGLLKELHTRLGSNGGSPDQARVELHE